MNTINSAPICARCNQEIQLAEGRKLRKTQRFCSTPCRVTAYDRRKAGLPESDPQLDADSLIRRYNALAAELTATKQALDSTQQKISDQSRELRRYRYAAENADRNTEKKISHHGAVIVTAQQHAKDAEQVAMGFIAEVNRLRDENARLRDRLRESLATVETVRARTAAKPKVQRTLATQVYFAFHQLAKDYRELRRGTDLDDSDYRLFDHAARNRARLKLNGTDIDQRTLYYFTRLTTAAYQRGKQQNHQDANTANNIKLYNVVSKLVVMPKSIRPFGETTRIPEPKPVTQA
jgi:regulator of replication initiation timing